MPSFTCDACGAACDNCCRGCSWCDDCSIRFEDDFHALEQWEADYRRQVFASFAIAPDRRTSPTGVIQRIENAIGRSVACEPDGPFETANWWYVPEYSIGCSGFIVDKRDDNVMALGSACRREQQFKNYNAGFRHDLIDLAITEVFDRQGAVQFLLRQRLWHNPRSEVLPDSCPSNGPVAEPRDPECDILQWTQAELATALNSLPATFNSQRVHARSFIDPAMKLPFAYTVARGS